MPVNQIQKVEINYEAMVQYSKSLFRDVDFASIEPFEFMSSIGRMSKDDWTDFERQIHEKAIFDLQEAERNRTYAVAFDGRDDDGDEVRAGRMFTRFYRENIAFNSIEANSSKILPASALPDFYQIGSTWSEEVQFNEMQEIADLYLIADNPRFYLAMIYARHCQDERQYAQNESLSETLAAIVEIYDEEAQLYFEQYWDEVFRYPACEFYQSDYTYSLLVFYEMTGMMVGIDDLENVMSLPRRYAEHTDRFEWMYLQVCNLKEAHDENQPDIPMAFTTGNAQVVLYPDMMCGDGVSMCGDSMISFFSCGFKDSPDEMKFLASQRLLPPEGLNV